MNEDVMPKIFISYSWTSEKFVIPLAERLREHGVDVILDKWDLKEGQDKYKFMEQCVNNPDITKVLIICDKAYVDKANGRKGGVGDETAIISGEIYGNESQEKFMPIVIEHDDEGKVCVPTYIKSRIYIDFSDETQYEENYEKLLRSIYNKPLYRKPKLGKMPKWLEEEEVSLFPVKDLVRQIKGSNSEAKTELLIKEFISKYIEVLKEFYDGNRKTGEEIYNTFVDMKDVRDVFLDWLDIVPMSGKAFGDLLANFFENAYNTLTNKDTFNPQSNSWYESSFEIYRIFLWELFICVTTFLLNKGDFIAINRLLTNTYFVKKNSSAREDIADYTIFRHHSRIIEEEYKPKTEFKQKYTMLGDCICNQREKRPLYTKKSIADADLFLYQIYNALDNKTAESIGWNYWFPTLYVYTDSYDRSGIWIKMKSKRFALKMCELVDVDSVEELIKRIKKCETNRDMKYTNCFDSAPGILAYITPEEIASLN